MTIELLDAQALNIGQQAFSVFVSLGVMLYLTFFLLRDGPFIAALVVDAIPLHSAQRRALAQKFIAVVRATIKGLQSVSSPEYIAAKRGKKVEELGHVG